MPGTVLGAEYTIDSKQVKTALALWSFQSSGEVRHRELQKHSESNNSDLGYYIDKVVINSIQIP